MKFNKLDGTKDWIEIVFGGLCGVAAIIAAIVEYRLGENGAFAGMLKDVFGTAVVVALLLFAAMPEIKPRKLDKILEREMESWGEKNAPLIFKTEGYKSSEFAQGFCLLQNPQGEYITLAARKIEKGSAEWSRYAKYGNMTLTGKFLDMPSYVDMTAGNFKIHIYMEQSHFDKIEKIDKIISDIVNAAKLNSNGAFVDSRQIGVSRKIELTCKQIETAADVECLVEALDFVLSLVKVVM